MYNKISWVILSQKGESDVNMRENSLFVNDMDNIMYNKKNAKKLRLFVLCILTQNNLFKKQTHEYRKFCSISQSVLNTSVLLLTISFIITLLKYSADPFGYCAVPKIIHTSQAMEEIGNSWGWRVWTSKNIKKFLQLI